jgi:hypothetical protein
MGFINQLITGGHHPVGSGIIIITYVITQLLGIYGIYVVGLLDYDPVHGVFICLYHHQHSNNWMMPNAK